MNSSVSFVRLSIQRKPLGVKLMVNVEYTNAFLREWIGPPTVPRKPSHVPYVTSI